MCDGQIGLSNQRQELPGLGDHVPTQNKSSIGKQVHWTKSPQLMTVMDPATHAYMFLHLSIGSQLSDMFSMH